jgi:hypothetical protein
MAPSAAVSTGLAPIRSPPFFSMDGMQGDTTHLLQECDAVIGDHASTVIAAR